MIEPGASPSADQVARPRVLVTGGFGFLGGHVLEQLLVDDVHEVHVVDNLSTSPVKVEVLLEELPSTARLEYDLCSVADFLRQGPEHYDIVIHLASVVGPAGVLQHGGRIVSSIVDDTYLLADYALEHGTRLVDVSTSEVYGGGRDGLCREEDQKIVPAETSFRLEYAVAKLAAETALSTSMRATAWMLSSFGRSTSLARGNQAKAGLCSRASSPRPTSAYLSPSSARGKHGVPSPT